MKRILILYPGFPHYRKGIIDKLIESKQTEYYFVGDRHNYIKSIRPYDFGAYPFFHHIKSYKIGPFVLHQNLLKYLLFKKFDGAIVHSSPYWITILIGVIILKLRGIKVYNWCHGILNNKKNLKNHLYYYFFKIFHGLVIYGNIAKKNLISLGYQEQNINVIYNSLNYEEQINLRETFTETERNKLREELFVNSDYHQLIFIGRLTVQKKLDLLIHAVKVLKEENIYVNLLFVGEGENKDVLKILTDNYKISDQVRFYGASYEEITNFQLISSSDCCVAPGEVGLTAIHVLTYGVPVISHNNSNEQMPEFESIKHGVNGALYEQHNVLDLKDKIKLILKIIKDKPRTEIKKDCYKIIDQYYNPNFQLNIIENLFN